MNVSIIHMLQRRPQCQKRTRMADNYPYGCLEQTLRNGTPLPRRPRKSRIHHNRQRENPSPKTHLNLFQAPVHEAPRRHIHHLGKRRSNATKYRWHADGGTRHLRIRKPGNPNPKGTPGRSRKCHRNLRPTPASTTRTQGIRRFRTRNRKSSESTGNRKKYPCRQNNRLRGAPGFGGTRQGRISDRGNPDLQCSSRTPDLARSQHPIQVRKRNIQDGDGTADHHRADTAKHSNPELANQINAKLRNDEYVWGTTQDNAWATVALAAFAARFPQDNKASATIQINNNPPKPFNPNTAFAQKLDEGNTAVIHNTENRLSSSTTQWTESQGICHLRKPIWSLLKGNTWRRRQAVANLQARRPGNHQITLTSIAEIKDAILLESRQADLKSKILLATRANSIPKEAFANFGAFMPQFADRRTIDSSSSATCIQPENHNFLPGKSSHKGQYTIPSTLFEAMYNPNIKTFADQQGILLIQ